MVERFQQCCGGSLSLPSRIASACDELDSRKDFQSPRIVRSVVFLGEQLDAIHDCHDCHNTAARALVALATSRETGSGKNSKIISLPLSFEGVAMSAAKRLAMHNQKG